MKVFLCCVFILAAVAARGELVVSAAHLRHPNTHTTFSTGAGMSIDGAVYDNRLAQTFLTTSAGFLREVSLLGFYYPSDAPTVPLRMDVTEFLAGQPGKILATAYVPLSQFPTSAQATDPLNIVASFANSGVMLAEGTTYSFVLRSDTVDANYRFVGGGTENLWQVPGYTDGVGMKSQNGEAFQPISTERDLYFQVSVMPVPEPSALGMLIAGGVVLAGIVRRGAR